MSAASDCMQFLDYIRAEIAVGRHPMSFLFRSGNGLRSESSARDQKPDRVVRRVTDDAVYRARALRARFVRWDDVEREVGFTRPALSHRARELGLSLSRPPKQPTQ